MKNLIITLSVLIFSNLAYAQVFERVEDQIRMDHVEKMNGVAVADYDQDGDLDVFFTGIEQFNPNDESSWNRLLQNNGDGTFKDVTIEAGFRIQYVNEGLLAERGEKMGAAWGDYDNDGFPDLFLANSREDQLYHNNGNGTFSDVTETAGVKGCNTCYSASGLWWDHDRDGDLDLYVSVLNGANIMYENLGDGSFLDITEQTGIGGKKTITWASVAIDVGKDGYLDLLNVNDTELNEFFENRSGLSYNEASRAYRLDDEGAGMGITVGDYNNDGLFDLYITNIFSHHPNPLFTNKGNRRYSDDAEALKVWDTGWAWGTHFFDYDHDGDEDLAVVNGPIDKLQGNDQPDIDNFFFTNYLENGQTEFVEESMATGFVGKAKGKGLEVFDYDMDGDLDLVVANMEEPAYFFKNNTIEDSDKINQNWLQIKLEGTTSNRDGFGTEVKIKMKDQSLYRFHHGAAIFGGSIKPVHFGLGNNTIIDEIRFTWLSGLSEVIYNVPANQLIHFKEGDGTEVEEEDEGPKVGAIIEKNSSLPNPFTEKTTLRFELASAGELNLNIFSSVGKLVFQTSENLELAGVLDIEFDGTSLAEGLYFYKAKFNDKEMQGKLMKMQKIE